ncbi:hypothetical protein PQX77_009200 [Marasmius sp. AFHP31]|nr:hypothetical protein PQX77_009200 [Marasmius sp. AFHP31]
MPSTRGDLDCKFPFELVIQTLDQCDQETLLTCSLVCRSWMPSCRSQIFREFEIGGGNEQQCLEIASLLESKHSTIPEFIEEMKLDLKYTDLTLTSCHSLETILRHLKNRCRLLKKLYLAYNGMALLSSMAQVSNLGTFAQQLVASLECITELELHLYHEHDTRILIEFTSSFPQLEVLKMHSGYEWESDHAHLLPYTLPSSLRTLQFGGDDDVQVEGLAPYDRWLSLQIPLHLSNLSIYKIKVQGSNRRLHPDIGPFLRRCTELRFLHLGFDTGYVILGAKAFYDLSMSQHLEILVVSIRNVAETRLDSVLLGLIQNMLNTLTSPCLRNISFNVSGSGSRRRLGHYGFITLRHKIRHRSRRAYHSILGCNS